MADVIGGIAMSHAPQLLMPPDKWSELPNRTKGPFRPKPGIEAEITPAAMAENGARCRRAIGLLRAKLDEWRPDAILVFGDDQHENILDDNMPPFVVYTGAKVSATRHFTYLGETALAQMDEYDVDEPLSTGLLRGLMEKGFDPAWSKKTRDETGLGHAFGRALKFLMPERRYRIVPVMVNTYYPPAPSAKRCFAFGQSIRAALSELPAGRRVAVIASGGLSHTKIDEALDAEVLSAIERCDADYLQALPDDRLVEGTSEIRNWIIAAAIMNRPATVVDYVPCYRNADGVGCGMGFAFWR